MSLPFFDTLQQCFPHSTIDVIAKETIQEVFLHHSIVHTIHPLSKSQIKGLRGLFNYGKTLRRHGPYDLFVTLPSSFSSALIGYGVGSKVRIGFKAEGRSVLLTHSVPQKHGIHRVHVYHHLLKALEKSVPQDESVKKITFPFSEKERQASFLTKQDDFKYVVFNVNSDAPSRRLPLEKWIALGNKLLRNSPPKIKIVFIGTPGEQPRVAEVMRAIEPQEHLFDFSGKTSIRNLAMLLRDADVVVTNDSGPMHLANAVGAPLVTFIGAADPIETKPFNQGNTIVIHKQLTCSPCVKNVCKFPTVRCLEQITVDEIYQSVLKLLNC